MKNKLIFLVLIAILSNCTKNLVRLDNPKTEKAKSNFGVVAFGLFVKQAPMGLFADKDSYYSSPQEGSGQTKFNRVIAYDEKSKQVEITPFFPDEPIPDEKIDKNQYYLSNYTENIDQAQNQDYRLGTSFGFLIEDRNKEFILSGVTTGCGDKCILSLRIRPEDAYQIMPIKIKPGDINFLGNFMVNVITIDSGTFGIGVKKEVRLESATALLLQTKDEDLKKSYFGSEEQTEKGMELNFLKNFASLQVSGHWKALAESKIKAIKSKKMILKEN